MKIPNKLKPCSPIMRQTFSKESIELNASLSKLLRLVTTSKSIFVCLSVCRKLCALVPSFVFQCTGGVRTPPSSHINEFIFLQTLLSKIFPKKFIVMSRFPDVIKDHFQSKDVHKKILVGKIKDVMSL